MSATIQLATEYFNSYEQREQAFRASVFSLIPRKYSGPRLFWKDFTNVALEELVAFTRQRLAYITSNPRDGLAFGTPWQVLKAAALCARDANQSFGPAVEDVARQFDLVDLLDQPIRTLSGGETVKLALAKASVAATYTEKLIIASPFSWLSRENTHFFQRLFDRYRRWDHPVQLLALEGEDSDKPVTDAEFPGGILKDFIDFSLYVEGLRIPLGSSLNPIYSRQTHARVADFETSLHSPCLIVGENGRGKSLIARILAGAISFEGQAVLAGAEKSGPPRLLFQDVINQTLLRSFESIAGSTMCANGLKADEICRKLLTEYRTAWGDGGAEDIREPVTGMSGFRSLLEVKAMLVAVRLCGQPGAIILDEPDWGLTRTSAVALVAAIVKVAHSFGIPIILISHKPWWHPIAKSVIRVDRTPKTSDETGTTAFEIQLSLEGNRTDDLTIDGNNMQPGYVK
jgi:energy-coupling factor transporter ATP-binding protein EcfA2